MRTLLLVAACGAIGCHKPAGVKAMGDPPTEAGRWAYYCDTSTTRPFNPTARAVYHESGITKRRAYTLCARMGESGLSLTASPMNHWTRALTFQRIEVLTSAPRGVAIQVAANGTVAISEARALGVDEMKRVLEGVATDDPAARASVDALALPDPDPVAVGALAAKLPSKEAAAVLGLLHAYGVAYLPTYAEGVVDVTVTADAVSGSAVAARVDDLVAAVRKRSAEDGLDAVIHVEHLSRASEKLRAASVRGTWQGDALDRIEAATAEVVGAAKTPDALKTASAALAVLEAYLAAPESPPSATDKVQVEDVYNLAFFGGFGFATGDAASGDWDVEALDGTPVLVSNGTSYVDPELVLGATIYPGRQPRTATGLDFGVSAGVGVLAFDEAGVSAFRSVYLGPSVGWSHLSVTPALVVKTGKHLRDGFAVGDPMPPGTTDADAAIETRPGLGFGLMVHLPWGLIHLGKNGAPKEEPDKRQEPTDAGVTP